MKQAIKPSFTDKTARAKVKAAEDAWNTRDPERVALAYTEDFAVAKPDQLAFYPCTFILLITNNH